MAYCVLVRSAALFSTPAATGQNWKGKGYKQPTGEFLNVFLFLLILQRYLRNPHVFPKAKLLEAVMKL